MNKKQAFLTIKKFLVLSCFFSLQVLASAPDLVESWQKTKFSFSYAKDLLNSRNCYQSEVKFLGCINALNFLLRQLTPSKILRVMETELPNERNLYFNSIYELLNTDIDLADLNDKEITNINENLLNLRTQVSPSMEEWPTSVIEQIYELKNQAKNLKAQLEKQDQERWSHYFNRSIRGHAKYLNFSQLVDSLVELLKTENIIDQNNESYAAAELTNNYLKIIGGPHSALLPRSFEDYVATYSGESFGGIGANFVVNPEGALITDLSLNGPAASSGLKYKDIIISAQNENNQITEFAGKNSAEILQALRGQNLSRVKLLVQREGKLLDRPIIVERGTVSIENTSTKTISYKGKKYVHLRLLSFTDNSCNEVKNALLQNIKEDTSGLIFDLRSNGGGNLEQVICIGGLFLGRSAPIVGVKTFLKLSQGNFLERIPESEQRINFSFASNFWPLKLKTYPPIIVLQDSGSASASEILASALQDSYSYFEKPALIVGEKSFGKGSVQRMTLKSSDISYLAGHDDVYYKVTIAQFFRKSGASTEIAGVTPDIEINFLPKFTQGFPFSIRETDLGTNIINQSSVQWRDGPMRRVKIEEVKRCMSGKLDQGAENFYQEINSHPIYRPDYQLNQTLETFGCL